MLRTVKDLTEKVMSSDLEINELSGKLTDADKNRRIGKVALAANAREGVLLKELSKQLMEMRESMTSMQKAHRQHSRRQAKEIALLRSGAAVAADTNTADKPREHHGLPASRCLLLV